MGRHGTSAILGVGAGLVLVAALAVQYGFLPIALANGWTASSLGVVFVLFLMAAVAAYIYEGDDEEERIRYIPRRRS